MDFTGEDIARCGMQFMYQQFMQTKSMKALQTA